MRTRRANLILLTLITAMISFHWHCSKSEDDRIPFFLLLTTASSDADLLTPLYYDDSTSPGFQAQVDRFLEYARAVSLRNPLDVGYSIPSAGTFTANKGAEYHHAIDLHPTGDATNVTVSAAHDGKITICQTQGLPAGTVYRHFISIATDIKDSGNNVIGKMVTIYGHLALDLDAGMPASGSTVTKGQVISQHLYASTAGGPHLHFEIRYYRSGDDVTNTCTLNGTSTGLPEYYGSFATGSLTTKSAGPWSLGYWDPAVGYGYGNPLHHGLNL